MNGFIEKEFELLDEIDLDWAYIYFYYDEDNDMSYNNGSGKSANLLMVKSDDENIDLIIIRLESKIIETKINVDGPQIIVIDNFTNGSSFDVIAVDKFG